MSDRIKRVKDKTVNYTIMLNEVFRRPDVSARAKGLYAYIMTLPDDWDLYKSELYKHFTEGRDALNTAFAELEGLGYIEKKPNRDDKGRVNGWVYTIYETVEHPTDSLESRETVSPNTVNPQLLSTDNIQNTNNTKYIVVLEKWNQLKLIHHAEKIVSAKWQKRHTSQVELYGIEATLKAIENYATIINSDEYYFKYRWSLWDFIARGLDQFIDEAMPFQNFLINSGPKGAKPVDPYKGLRL